MAKLHAMLQAYEPSPGDPFDRVKAAHLLNRAGFGGTPDEVEHVLKLGPRDAVDWLLDFPDAGAEEQSREDVPDLSAIEGYPRTYRQIQQITRGLTPEERMAYRQKLQAANRQAVVATANWWLARMAAGPHPLQEKLTLFWHGHFTTSARDERSASLLWQQNELLRRQAAGNFREFVRNVSRDPAMLDYLNNSQNRKAHPNENYARELMELFTLGIGNYTEDDVKEAARAFTGWAHDGDDFLFRANQHDNDEKAFFGRRGNFDGDDVIDLILAHRACAPYVAGRLLRFFVRDDAPPDVAAALGDVLREHRWDLRPVLRTMFTSRAFYAPDAVGTQIKSPVQLVVGTIRLLGLDMPPGRALTAALNQMGQVPLEPPNVKGWPGGRTWINTSTLFVRYNTAVWLAGGDGPGRGGGQRARGRRGGFDVSLGNGDGTSDDPAAVVDDWLARLVQRPVDETKKQYLVDAVGDVPTDESVEKVVQLIVSMPEYQLC